MSQFCNGIANSATGRVLDTLCNMGQFVLLGPSPNRISNIYNHITSATYSFFHNKPITTIIFIVGLIYRHVAFSKDTQAE